MAVRIDSPDRLSLRRFGLTVGSGFILIGAVSWWRDHTIAPRALWVVGILVDLLALLAPRALARVERAWFTLGEWLAWISTRVILTALFYAVVTPIGALKRLVRDPLDRRLGDGRESYWIRRGTEPVDAKSYERQF